MTRLKAFGRFWYEFIVGDDWRVAVGVAAGIALTAVLASGGLSAWWLMPLVVVATLFGSLWRASQPRRNAIEMPPGAGQAATCAPPPQSLDRPTSSVVRPSGSA